MIDIIYVEEDLLGTRAANAVLHRFPRSTIVVCEHYGEVFNPAAQNFRLQKRRPALILARKRGNLVHPAPSGFGIGTAHNFYFSHMLNCLYDCRYCFLQGMLRSAHYVLFVNYDDFQAAIASTIAAHADESCTFFSGYDCDSLAFEAISGFADAFLPFFASFPETTLELRTKSVATQPLLGTAALPNVVVAFSFTPAPAAAAFEHGVPSVADRIEALGSLAAAGWPVAIRLDPLLWYEGWRDDYRDLIDAIAATGAEESLHSVSVGPLRFPHQMFRRVTALYPDEPLLAGPLQRRGRLASYGEERERELIDFVQGHLGARFPSTPMYRCTPEPE